MCQKVKNDKILLSLSRSCNKMTSKFFTVLYNLFEQYPFQLHLFQLVFQSTSDKHIIVQPYLIGMLWVREHLPLQFDSLVSSLPFLGLNTIF